MRNIASAVGGLAQGLNAYLGKTIDTQAKMAEQQQQSDLQARNTSEQQAGQLNNQQTLELYRQTLAGKVSPDVAAQIHPEAAGMVQKFNEQNGRMPTVDEFNNLMDNVSGGDKDSKQQDTLEKQALDRLTTVRGDQSLMRSEHQRDAAGMAYDTIAKARSEGRDLTELEQNDLTAQLWQARTGKSPTDQDMKAINDRTAKRGFNHVITYLTGDPGLIGASTPETLANLQQFIEATGSKADQQWDAYMSPRMTKPTGLHPDRWDHIKSSTRGIPFKDQKATSDKTYVSKGKSVEDKRAALRSKLGL